MVKDKKPASDVAQLKRLAERIEEEIAALRGEIAPLERRLDAAKSRLDLTRRLIRLTEGSRSSRTEKEAPPPASSAQATSITDNEGSDLESHLEEILKDAKGPMHISQIRQILVEQAIPLPGRGDEANIILRLRRAPHRFTRTGRGMYALASLGFEAVPAATRSKAVARKKS